MIGEIQIVFDTPAMYTIETLSYCNIGIISYNDVHDLLIRNPHIRQDLRDEILWNPHDYHRDEFVQICRRHIAYLRDVEEELLKKLYYQCKQRFIQSSQYLFKCGDRCREIHFII